MARPRWSACPWSGRSRIRFANSRRSELDQWSPDVREEEDVRDSRRRIDPLADRGDHRDRRWRLYRELALPPFLEGSLVRSHRLPGRTRGDQWWRVRAAFHPRLYAGQHERAADG